MQIMLLAPARLSCRPDLARLVSEEAAGVALQRVSRAQADGIAPDAPTAGRGDRVIEEHMPLDPALVPPRIWSGTLSCGTAPEVRGGRLTAATAHVTAHGGVLMALTLDVDDPVMLRRVEDALGPWVVSRIAALSTLIGGAVAAAGLGHQEPASRRDLREDAFLWWHRLLVGPVSDAVLAGYELDRYPTVQLRPGESLRVGDGYSHLCGATAAEAVRVLDGLAVATQVWMSVDQVQRRLTDYAGRLRLAGSPGNTGARGSAKLYAEATDLYEQATIETSVILQTLRYTVGPQRQAYDLAAQSWNISKQLDPLVQSAEALRQAVERRHQQARDAASARLAGWVSALTLVSGLTVVLTVFETAVGHDLPDRLQTARLVVSGVVVALALACLLWVLRQREE